MHLVRGRCRRSTAGSSCRRHHVQLHAGGQRETHWHSNRLLRHLMSKRKENQFEINLIHPSIPSIYSPVGTLNDGSGDLAYARWQSNGRMMFPCCTVSTASFGGSS